MQEVITIKVDKGVLKKIHSLGLPYDLKYVDVTDIDYSYDTLWTKLYSASTKAYRALKRREFDLRNNNIKNDN